ncbi:MULTISPECIES: COX15/CtaA family protein [Nocardiopsis]|uniref:Cytochrome c oxidase assembly protein subunit 15 n=1 Tax=Nocardiopsis sinuspersici TaxID=501010 RepID=A0A1V3C1B4_9ACTN|nr:MULTISPECIES: COX15/CtaA family protein [Nocardiopsis]NYH50721.1 cytochrome c oxidase assembly protein subunit 15 [Nocardiopsis sinuspersici]OOC54574.1 transporter [Nocardiopsis sinuspersici]
MSVSPASAVLAANTVPPLAAEDIALLGAPLWVWQIAVVTAGVLALVLLARTIWHPTRRSLRAWALGNIVVNAGIAVTGATVRVTSSGLGCSEWPRCTPESFVPVGTEHAALNAAIEFGNRTLTFVVLAVAVITFVAVMRMSPRRRDLVRMAAVVPFGVLGQGVVGGITVWSDLHPASVAAHFLLSMVVVFVTVALYVRCREPEGRPRVSVGPMLHAVSVGLVVVGFMLLVAGTVVTGTGPHGGDAAAPRWAFDLPAVTRLHSALAWLTLAGALLATVIAFRGGARRPVRRSSAFLLAVVVLQGVLGYTQYALGLPETLVVLHVLGSTLTWVAVCRLYFSTTRLTPPGREVSEDPADLLDRDAGRSPVGPAPGR